MNTRLASLWFALAAVACSSGDDSSTGLQGKPDASVSDQDAADSSVSQGGGAGQAGSGQGGAAGQSGGAGQGGSEGPDADTQDGTVTEDGAPACIAAHEAPVFTKPASDAIAFDALLEAAGYGAADNSDWAALAAGDLCGGPDKELVLLKNSHSYFSVLRGPAPFAVGSGDVDSAAAHPWRAAVAADLDGDGKDEIVALRHVTAAGVHDIEAIKADSTCKLTKLAGLSLGSAANSDWVGAAAGDFDGDGKQEVVALKQAHSNFVMVRLAAGQLSAGQATDLDSDSSHPWRAVAAGDLDGDGRAELVAARLSSDGADTVFAYRFDKTSNTFVKIASSNIGNTGASDWAGAAVGDFNADGKASIVLAKDSHSNFIMLGYDGTQKLASAGSSDLFSAPGQLWKGIAAVDWLGGDQGATELVAARAATGKYRTDLFVHGNRFHRTARDSGVAATEAQYAAEPRASADAPADIAQLKQWLVETHATSYSWLLWDTNGNDYVDFVRFLDATRDFCIDGRQLRVWVTLIPPTEHASGKCSIAAQSDLTPFDEASFFSSALGEASCEDYVGWSALLGELAAQFPHLVAVNVDDFSHNVASTFTPEVLAKMQSNLRAKAPWMNLLPTSYYKAGSSFVLDAYPDLGASVDGLLFYFRNEKEGLGPCSACPPPGSCAQACLSGTCAEKTVPNAAGEIADFAAGMPDGRKLQVGVYATGHSSCGTPSHKYVRDLMTAALENPKVNGVTVYTTKHPAGDCATLGDDDLGCVVQSVFGDH